MADTITGNVKLIIDAEERATAKIKRLTAALKKNLSPEEFKRVTEELDNMPRTSAKAAKEIAALKKEVRGAEREARS